MDHEPTSLKPISATMATSTSTDSDDDWETADLDNFAPPKLTLAQPLPMSATHPASAPGLKILSRPNGDASGSLRPSAPAFEPKPRTKLSGAKLAWRGPQGAADQDEWYRDSISRGPNTNRTIWDEANKGAPPVTLISSNDTTGAPLPPPPSIKILRRPSPSQSTPQRSSSASSDDRKKTLEQRELEYQRARERIFASSGGGGERESVSAPTSNRESPSSSPRPQVPVPLRQPQGVLRQPRGPDDRSGAGFMQGIP